MPKKIFIAWSLAALIALPSLAYASVALDGKAPTPIPQTTPESEGSHIKGLPLNNHLTFMDVGSDSTGEMIACGIAREADGKIDRLSQLDFCLKDLPDREGLVDYMEIDNKIIFIAPTNKGDDLYYVGLVDNEKIKIRLCTLDRQGTPNAALKDVALKDSPYLTDAKTIKRLMAVLHATCTAGFEGFERQYGAEPFRTIKDSGSSSAHDYRARCQKILQLMQKPLP
jgi:hypothetical protein